MKRESVASLRRKLVAQEAAAAKYTAKQARLGEVRGMEQSAEIVLDRAAKDFRDFHDVEAKALRGIAIALRTQATARRNLIVREE